MTDNKNMLKDEMLEEVSGGSLVNNWKEELEFYAGEYRSRGISFDLFKADVLKGYLDYAITKSNSPGFNNGEKLEIEKFLKTIRWE